MSNQNRFSSYRANHPRQNIVPEGFVVVGDGRAGDELVLPPFIDETSKQTPFFRISAVAANIAVNRIVAATSVASQTFIYSDDAANNWFVVEAPEGFVGFCDRIFWVDAFSTYIGLCVAGSSHSLCTSPDGKVWTPRVSGIQHNEHVGFAYNADRIVITFKGGGNNLLISDDAENWFIGANGIAGDLSIIWHPNTNEFIGFESGTSHVYTSANGESWSGIADCATVVNGAYVAYELQTGRVVVFGSQMACVTSDDDCLSWQEATGIDEYTGDVNRYVAIKADTVYVAYYGQINFGIVSVDGGSSWDAAYHQSGNPAGAAVVA